ncbi:IclR family transcriptional regulator [Hydrogenispora ethanolica]|uniref:Glycerol operon regulatory protein n=1 Tax=Hydrogenispora ethanolica TaxID=1082276 RepID=A0A4R1S7A1_HYDET|nr:IclR family transcriptional regulator [Hydrogenispora ethanolica]TCL75255.1 IclR family transcriptional regulator [Hydrogenispora ethanolica]
MVFLKKASELREIKVKTVERTLALLEILAEQNSLLSLTKLSQISKLSISTTYRLLNTLCRSGFVDRDKLTGHYRLGYKAFLIGNAALQSVELRPIALPYMNQLASDLRESIYLSVLSNHNVIYSDCIKASGPIQFGIQTGIPVPSCQTSSGKVMLAFLPADERRKWSEFFSGSQLLSDPGRFAAVLDSIHQQGFAAEVSDFSGTVREISVPIFNYLKICSGALSVFRPVSGTSLTPEEQLLLEQLQAAAKAISLSLGYSPSDH